MRTDHYALTQARTLKDSLANIALRVSLQYVTKCIHKLFEDALHVRLVTPARKRNLVEIWDAALTVDLSEQ